MAFARRGLENEEIDVLANRLREKLLPLKKKKRDDLLHEKFKEIDTNGDGTVTLDEFSSALKKYEFFDLNRADARKLFEHFDRFKRKRVAYADFVAFVCPNPAVDELEQKKLRAMVSNAEEDGHNVDQMFQKYDTKRTGFVSRREFTDILDLLPHSETLSKVDENGLMVRVYFPRFKNSFSLFVLSLVFCVGVGVCVCVYLSLSLLPTHFLTNFSTHPPTHIGTVR